jgi:nucleotide-binding universal stress UspA family protein
LLLNPRGEEDSMAILPIRKLLVPVDFSRDADQAVTDAIEIARAAGATIELVHVWRMPVQPTMPEAGLVPIEAVNAIRKADEERLHAQAAAIREAGVDCNAHVIEGIPSHEIVHAVGTFDADLIVIGTRGQTGLKHILMGSVASRVTRRAPCPVLTVKADDSRGGIRPGVVLVPTDFSQTARHALEVAQQVATSMGPARLVLAHAYYVPVEIEVLIATERGGDGGLLDRMSDAAAEELERILENLQEAGVSVEYAARHGSPEQVIEELAKEFNADLIVMGTHGRSGLRRALMGSVAEHVVRTAECPVLTVRPTKED